MIFCRNTRRQEMGRLRVDGFGTIDLGKLPSPLVAEHGSYRSILAVQGATGQWPVVSGPAVHLVTAPISQTSEARVGSGAKIGRATGRERVGPEGEHAVGGAGLQKDTTKNRRKTA